MDHHGNRPDLANQTINESDGSTILFVAKQYDVHQQCDRVHMSWIPLLTYAYNDQMSLWPLSNAESAAQLSLIRGMLSELTEEYALWQKKLTESSALLEQLSLKASGSGNSYITGGGGLGKARADFNLHAAEARIAKQRIICFGKLEEAMCQHLPSKFPNVAAICAQGSVISQDIFE